MKLNGLSFLMIAVSVTFSSCNSEGKSRKSQADTTSKVDTLAKIDLLSLSEKSMKVKIQEQTKPFF